MNKKILYTIILSIGFSTNILNAKKHHQRHHLDETTITLYHHDTKDFATDNSRIHSKFDIKTYQLDMSGYPHVPAHEVYLVPTNYRLYIGGHAPEGSVRVLGLNPQGKVKSTTNVLIQAKKKNN